MKKNILEIQIQAMSVMVRVDGMKAENQTYTHNNLPVPYGECFFEDKACELDSLWQELTRCE